MHDSRSFIPVGCWIDLFDGPAFGGERRRIFGPARLDARFLGLGHPGDVSVRVGGDAALRIGLDDGDAATFDRGESARAIVAGKIRWIEVRAVTARAG